MRNLLVIGLMFLSAITFAQTKIVETDNYNIDALIDRSEYFQISDSQKQKILLYKNNAGKDFEKIGRNRNLSGYEKGMKKKDVALKLHNNVSELLNASQRKKWTEFCKDEMRNKEIDKKIDKLEEDYEADIKRIERQYASDKTLVKSKKEIRKEEYKKEKELLKKYKVSY